MKQYKTLDGLTGYTLERGDESYCIEPNNKDCRQPDGQRCRFWWLGNCMSRRPVAMPAPAQEAKP